MPSGIQVPETMMEKRDARQKLIAELNLDQDTRFIGFVGHLARDKGVSSLIEAFKIILEHESGLWPKESIFRERQIGLAKQLFSLMDIQRNDTAKRTAWMENGFRFFDAPVAIIITVDRLLTVDGPLLDIGAVMQNICLAAVKHGLGTCIEDQGVVYPQVIRTYANIPDSKRIVLGIALGYPDPEYPANQVQTKRAHLETNTTWIGW